MLLQIQYGIFKGLPFLDMILKLSMLKGKKKTISLLYLTMQAIVSAPRCMCIFSIPKVAMWGFKLIHCMFLNVGSWVDVA
jgi:hypothetical protein